MVERIGKEQIAGAVERQIERSIQPRLRRRPVVAGVSRLASADHRSELHVVHSHPMMSVRENVLGTRNAVNLPAATLPAASRSLRRKGSRG